MLVLWDFAHDTLLLSPAKNTHLWKSGTMEYTEAALTVPLEKKSGPERS